MIEQEEKYDLFGEIPPAVVDKNQEIKNSIKIHNAIIKRFTCEIIKPLFVDYNINVFLGDYYYYKFASGLDLYNFNCCYDDDYYDLPEDEVSTDYTILAAVYYTEVTFYDNDESKEDFHSLKEKLNPYCAKLDVDYRTLYLVNNEKTIQAFNRKIKLQNILN